MSSPSPEVIICGAGICGVSAAYHLTVKQGFHNVLLVDERDPMTFTSDKSTECYRNWWPGPGDVMVRFMNRSIDLLEELALESHNYFGLNRRGYVFLTADPERAHQYADSAKEISELGAGPLRIHHGSPGDPIYRPSPAEGFQNLPTGADLILDPDMIQEIFPFVSRETVAMLHLRRCGWLSAQQLGTYLLEKARAHGLSFLKGRVTGVNLAGGGIHSVQVDTGLSMREIRSNTLVISAGPFLPHVAEMINLTLPVYNELHAKVAIQDRLGIVPYGVPLMLWDDPIQLEWEEAEREELSISPETRWLLEQFPAGVHFRPEGRGENGYLLGLWTYDIQAQEPVANPTFEAEYPEVVMRGLVRMIPGLRAYIGKMGRPIIDGGYYCKTNENRPLIGPLPVKGAYVFGAVSGFGIMAGMAGGELLAAQIANAKLPDYASAFLLQRYEDPAYQALLNEFSATSGQL